MGIVVKPPLRENQLTGRNQIFGWRISRRTAQEPLVEVYVEDDEFWHYTMSFSIYWAPELRQMADALLAHGHINPGACDPLNPEGEVK